MKRTIITTADGSKTIHLEAWNEQYHSKHGAVQEAYHVFVDRGLSAIKKSQISILEIGFGTGLNALITFLEATAKGLQINYTGVERYPVIAAELDQLNYISELKAEEYNDLFRAMHSSSWEVVTKITPYFRLCKQQKDFKEIEDVQVYDLIYFDAFGARVQPELWTEEIFQIMFNSLKKNGILVTYAAKGSVRRAMLAVGFQVERLPGPPGKREMLRATRIQS
ncbi:tRNA (5-methylaminomethyl-2-thiouridine)(34)-methyltransferase MnmD [uncultured Muriicola sp.]|uniref:tRNA (5-methylaminomethyl-2-thiouridine)(34)-methyltransferase MnmD n=1 Tax=uncultured Muriicola sp. TaxID=1583102 RepID=UPI0026144689|nr:tRNA (5-methylaminomethyl-2-thiouridine)(34)-methyltransferase MnmD [uncultured Muriicola sp.]